MKFTNVPKYLESCVIKNIQVILFKRRECFWNVDQKKGFVSLNKKERTWSVSYFRRGFSSIVQKPKRYLKTW